MLLRSKSRFSSIITRLHHKDEHQFIFDRPPHLRWLEQDDAVEILRAAPGIDRSFGATSAAAAICAGVGALVLTANEHLTSWEVRQILREASVPVNAAMRTSDPVDRYRRVDAMAAVSMALSWRAEPPVILVIPEDGIWIDTATGSEAEVRRGDDVELTVEVRNDGHARTPNPARIRVVAVAETHARSVEERGGIEALPIPRLIGTDTPAQVVELLEAPLVDPGHPENHPNLAARESRPFRFTVPATALDRLDAGAYRLLVGVFPRYGSTRHDRTDPPTTFAPAARHHGMRSFRLADTPGKS